MNQNAATLSPDANGQQSLAFRLTGSQAKTAFALRRNCETLIAGNAKKVLRVFMDSEGREFKHWISEDPENLNSVGFLTLTVGEHHCAEHGEQKPLVSNLCPLCGDHMRFSQVKDAAEASRRINNLNRRILPDLFERAICVTERHKNGAVHFHVLGVLRGRPDIRTGLNWDEIRKAQEMRSGGRRPPSFLYRSASEKLRGIWAHLREVLPGYGFGQAELLPIRKTGEAVACYISKYVEKNICNRLKEDRRKKLVRYIGWHKEQLKPNEFAWGSKRAIAWRIKTRTCAALVDCYQPEQAADAFGPRWAFHISRVWQKVDDVPVPRLQANFLERELIRSELAKMVGREWCKKAHGRTLRDWKICGETYEREEFNEFFDSFPDASEQAYKLNFCWPSKRVSTPSPAPGPCGFGKIRHFGYSRHFRLSKKWLTGAAN